MMPLLARDPAWVPSAEDCLADQLVGDWNVYVAQTHHTQTLPYPIKPRQRNPANLKLMVAMVRWCRDRHLEPRLWLYYLFKRRGWRFAPKFKESELMTEKAVDGFGKMKGLGFFQTRMRASTQEKDGDRAYDPNRDLADNVEHLKARYVLGAPNFPPSPQRCLDDQLVTTLGFHPKSRVCAVCPLQMECALRLEASVPFPILALRHGRITSADAVAVMHP